MSTYVLVHGAWHGAWCWKKVVPLLEEKGHTVVTLDLPAHGDDDTPIAEATLDAYADRVCEVVTAQDEKVILVGHSMGGIAITQAAEQCPDNIETLVYLTAFLLPDGDTLLQYAEADAEALVLPNLDMNEDEGYASVKDEAIKEVFYHDCSDEDVAYAKERLTPQPIAPFVTPVSHTEENFGSIPRLYIECLKDKAISFHIQQRMYTKLPCKRVLTMTTSHSPFFSAPEELVGHLHSVAEL